MTDADSPQPSVLVAGIGNIFLADDGVGCEVVRHLADLAEIPEVTVTDYGIRGMHLTYDLLPGWDLLVLVDAVPDRGQPGAVDLLEVKPDQAASGQLDSHGMDPMAMLAGVGDLGGQLPRTCLVGIQVQDVHERIGLSDAVTAAIEPAAQAVREIVQEHLRRMAPQRIQEVG